MKELDYLKQKGILISKKQYKFILAKMISLMIIFVLIIMSGTFIMIFNTEENIIIAGVCIFLFGAGALIFYSFYSVWRYSAKLQLYRHYKKYPEDFDNEISIEINH